MRILQYNNNDNANTRCTRSLWPAFAWSTILYRVVVIPVAAADGSFDASTRYRNTSTRFGYSDNDLDACVRELDSSMHESNSNACLSLYRDFLEHYRRGDGERGEFVPLSSSPGYARFTKTVRVVYQHNHNYRHVWHKLRLNQFADRLPPYSKRSHDVEQEDQDNNWQDDLENLWEAHGNEEEHSKTEETDNRRSRKLRWKGTDVRLLGNPSSIRAEKEHRQQQQQQQKAKLRQTQKQHDVEEEPGPHRSLLQHYHTPLSSELRIILGAKHNTKVIMPGEGTNDPPRFSSPQVPELLMGTEVELHKGTSTDAYRNIPLVRGSANDAAPPHHLFAESLDWSTEHNPDGVPLVHEAFDQGTCGSCWAFAATGSIEASAARNIARDHFVNGLMAIDQELQDINNDDDDDDNDDDDDDDYGSGVQGKYHTLMAELVNESMQIEAQAFGKLRLSIQELLDCDVTKNEGCVGGNPLLAFNYIHKHGLVPWEEYPYEGYGRDTEDSPMTTAKASLAYDDDIFPTLITFPRKNGVGRRSGTDKELESNIDSSSCQKDKIPHPIATVDSWGLLHKNHEDLIEYALLYVGPVAVGINGADPAFINYGGGIYDNPDCDQNANHALLIVGYGQEDVTNANGVGQTVRYWIARNSWGEGWGENGFVKIKRGSGGKGLPGVCGIARSPSVALGGVYRENRTKPLKNRDTLQTTSRYRKGKYVVSYDSTPSRHDQREKSNPRCYSKFSGKSDYLFKGCVWFSILYERNQFLLLALISMLVAFIAIIPLGVSLRRQHRVAVRNNSIRLDRNGNHDSLSIRSTSSSRGTLSERTHLLTLKDMYAQQRRQEEETKRPRGRSIVMKSPEQDPFRLQPSSKIENSSDNESSSSSSTH